MVEEELSPEQPNNAAGIGLPSINDQVKLPLIHAFLLPLVTCQNLPGQAARGMGLSPAHPSEGQHPEPNGS